MLTLRWFSKTKSKFHKKMKNWTKSSFFPEPRKYLKVKHIESYKPRERYQAGTVLLSNYVFDRFKYILHRWII